MSGSDRPAAADHAPEAAQPRGFEARLTELEDRVRRLESGDVPLDEALALYEEGVALARACHEELDAAEERVVALSRGRDGIVDRPLE